MFISFSSNAAEKRYERRQMVHGPRIAQNAKLKKTLRHARGFSHGTIRVNDEQLQLTNGGGGGVQVAGEKWG